MYLHDDAGVRPRVDPWGARLRPTGLLRMLVIVLILGLVFLGISRGPRRYRVLLWTLVIVACVVPWWGFQWHAHWSRVELVAVCDWPTPVSRRGREPPPLRAVRPVPHGKTAPVACARAVTAIAAGIGLSLATELTQVYSHGRFPSATDVVMNGIGTVVGVLVGWRVCRGRR